MPSPADILEDCFPGYGESFASAIRSVDSLIPGAALSDDCITILGAVGKNRAGMERMIEALLNGTAVAMEYLGPISPLAPFDQRLCGPVMAGTGLDICILADSDGAPAGIVPLEEHTDRPSAFSSMRGRKCIIVTDAIQCSDDNIRGLERSGCDFILRQPQFPSSYAPNANQKMLQLRHDGRDYSASKCRFEKRWLFMFVRADHAEKAREAVASMDIRSQTSSCLMKSAGYENAISDTGHDIREVRDLLDIRVRTDRLMSVCRTLVSSDDRLMLDRDALIGFVLAYVLGKRPDFVQ